MPESRKSELKLARRGEAVKLVFKTGLSGGVIVVVALVSVGALFVRRVS
jgi:hypothetical protein